MDRTRATTRALVALAAVGAAASLSACRDDRISAAPSAVVANDHEAPSIEEWTGPIVRIDAIDNTFKPEAVEVAPGTMVVWENRGRNDHDVIAIHGHSWGVTEVEFPPGAVYAHVFDEPGTYEYICTLHGSDRFIGMVGTVVVTS